MGLFDCHSDLLYRCVQEGLSPLDSRLETVLSFCPKGEPRLQALAVFLPDDHEHPQQLFEDQLTLFEEICRMPFAYQYQKGMTPVLEKTGCFLTLENAGALLSGNLEQELLLLAEKLLQIGFVAVSLCWNGANPLGGGVMEHLPLTEAGLWLAKELASAGVLLDVSHLSDEAFWQLADCCPNQMIATHSNCRAICPHPRNLTDQQLSFLFSHQGTVGLNFHAPFLSPSEEPMTGLAAASCHLSHLYSLGGEKFVCLGSDFDGGSPAKDLNSMELVAKQQSNMIQLNDSGRGEPALLEGLSFSNAYRRFFQTSQTQ